MSKVIIAVHGRDIKPKEDLYKDIWKKAINEGLSKQYGYELGNDIAFEMAYYSDIAFEEASNDLTYQPAKDGSIRRYEEAKINFLHRIGEDSFDVLIEKTRHAVSDDVAAFLEKKGGWLLYQALDFFLFKREGGILDGAFNTGMKDLSDYFSDPKRKSKVMQTLKDDLIAHRDKEIFLVSHSMGSIIAYEVLREIGRDETLPPIKVEHLVTLGSPLGYLFIKSKLLQSNHGKLRTPSCVNNWQNFSDPRDPVCFDVNLSNDYSPNSSNVAVKDVLIASDKNDDPHHILGYLRAPEFSQYLHSFL
ncbi:MAG: hypothetical protein AAGA18_15110 [Verrucomicrobiota bacterium]